MADIDRRRRAADQRSEAGRAVQAVQAAGLEKWPISPPPLLFPEIFVRVPVRWMRVSRGNEGRTLSRSVSTSRNVFHIKRLSNPN